MTNYVNPPVPATWKLYEGVISAEMSQWAEDTLVSYRTTGSPPMFGYETRDDLGGGTTYEAWVNWHPPDEENNQEHSGVTIYVDTDPSIVEPNPIPTSTPSNVALVQGRLGQRGVDTDTKLNATSAAALKAAGFQFVVRYVSLGSPDAAGDLSPSELQAVLAAGLELYVVQHVRAPGWAPTSALGTQYGTAAASDAAACGYPKGATIFCDLEGVAAGTPPANVSAYVNAWCTAVAAKGYEAGLYVGGASILNSDQLYATSATRYWRSFSAVPNVSNRGYCMLQLYPTTSISGIAVDFDVIQGDYKGGYPHGATSV